MYMVTEGERKKENEKKINFLMKFSKESGKVIDIGIDIGTLMKRKLDI